MKHLKHLGKKSMSILTNAFGKGHSILMSLTRMDVNGVLFGDSPETRIQYAFNEA